jgi:hypothetical protein
LHSGDPLFQKLPHIGQTSTDAPQK